MSRPRLLYVPIAAALEADKVVELVDWGDVATFDTPGVGDARDQAPRGVAGVVDAALARLDELGWERCSVICDSHAQAAAIELTLSNPQRVEAISISHAAARYDVTGPRPAMNPAMYDVAQQLLETDYRTFARAITQMTQGLASDEYLDRWIAAVPQSTAYSFLRALATQWPELVTRLRDVELPVVLGKHEGCVMWTDEAFEDAREAVPRARVVVCDGIPAHDPGFLAVVREISSGAASAG